MKKLFSYLNIAALLIAMSAMFAACTDKDSTEDALGLNIKVFAPTVVVPGTPMTINGSGFGDVTEIQFPGDITVTDFEIVTDEMIRVKAPAGLTQGGVIAVVNASGEIAISRLPLSVGHTEITGFYPTAENEGEVPSLKGNETLTVYGKDMQFIAGAEFLDEDGNPIYVPASEFLRVANGRVVIQVPAKVMTGTATAKIYLSDGSYVETPEYAFEPASNGGHWETVKRYVWENNGGPAISWSGTYRFCEVGHDFNSECIAEFESDAWEIIKSGTFYVDLESAAAEGPQIRVTTGWWSTTWGGDDIFPGNEKLTDLGDGKYTLEVNLSGDAILDVIDEQHFLLTGDRYKPTKIYYYK